MMAKPITFAPKVKGESKYEALAKASRVILSAAEAGRDANYRYIVERLLAAAFVVAEQHDVDIHDLLTR